VLPELIECLGADDDDIEEAARWAVRRIAVRRPEESWEAIRGLTAGADAAGITRIAMALSQFPEQPVKLEMLLSLLDGLAAFPKSDRHEVFMTVSFALGLSEGTKGLELAWSQLDRYRAMLPKRTRGDLREAMRARAAMDRIVPEPAIADYPEATVYDLCCPAWEDDDDEEDEDDNPFDDEDDFENDEEFEDEDDDFIPAPVRRAVTLGRNDPCWCGSGKKYKKCHLESDEKTPPAPTPEQEEPRGSAEEAELRGRLITFATETLRKRGPDESLGELIGGEPPAGGDSETLSREALDWMVHDYVSPRLGRVMIEEFLQAQPGRSEHAPAQDSGDLEPRPLQPLRGAGGEPGNGRAREGSAGRRGNVCERRADFQLGGSVGLLSGARGGSWAEAFSCPQACVPCRCSESPSVRLRQGVPVSRCP